MKLSRPALDRVKMEVHRRYEKKVQWVSVGVSVVNRDGATAEDVVLELQRVSSEESRMRSVKMKEMRSEWSDDWI